MIPSEQDLLRDMNTALRIRVEEFRLRIEEMELQRRELARAHREAACVVRGILDGAGASLDEMLRASVAMGDVTRLLATQPQPLEAEEARIPGRVVDLGVRIKTRRPSFYEWVQATEPPKKKG